MERSPGRGGGTREAGGGDPPASREGLEVDAEAALLAALFERRSGLPEQGRTEVADVVGEVVRVEEVVDLPEQRGPHPRAEPERLARADVDAAEAVGAACVP